MTAPDNKKIRLFCVITLGEMGGAQQFLVQLIGSLDPSRYDIMVVSGSQGRQDLATLLPAHVSWTTAPALRRDLSLIGDLTALRQIRTMMAEFRPDIVFLNSSKAGFVGAWAAQGLRGRFPAMKVVYRIGGWSFNDPWSAYKRRLYVLMERWSARWKDIIVVNNLHDLEQARALGIRPRRELMLVHNGIDPYRPLMRRDDARDELSSRIEQTSGFRPALTTVAGTIANFYETKGLDVLIEAAAHAPSVQFIVIGDGPLRSTLEQQMRRRGLEQRVFLTGMLPDAARYLPAFDMLVLPSRKEGFPWAVLEAMAAKIPVIVTRVGAIPEVLEDGVSGLLVSPGDAAALTAAITRLAEREQLRRDLAIRAHQQLLAKFTLRTMVDRYERLFNALSSGGL